MTKFLNFLLISSLTGAVTSSSTNLFNINNHEVVNSEHQVSLLAQGSQNLSYVITQRDLGDIIIPTNASDGAKNFAVMNALWNANQDLDLSGIQLKMVAEYGALVAADPNSDLYYGTVPIRYQFVEGQKGPLSRVLINKYLGEINTSGSVPTAEEVKSAIKKANAAVEVDHISIKYITGDHAMVYGDGALYTGTVGVEFYTSNSVALDRDLTKTDLNLVYFNKQLNEADLLLAIKRENAAIDTTAIMIFNLKNNSALIMGDGLHYTGQLYVTFKTVIQKPLSDDLKVLNLGSIRISQNDVSKSNQFAVFMNALFSENLDLDIMAIELEGGNSSITQSSTSAVVKGIAIDPALKIQSTYTGKLTVQFSFQIG